jgi:hypothetical protein
MAQALYVPSQPLQQNATSTGTGTPAVIGGYGIALVEITGTFNATIVIEGQTYQGNWYPLNAYQRGAGTYAQSITGPGLYEVNVRGLNAIRANITSYTSGTINAYATAQALSSGMECVSKYQDLGQVLDAGSIPAGATVYSQAYTQLTWVRNVIVFAQIDTAGWAVTIMRGDSSGVFDWAVQLGSSSSSTGANWGVQIGSAGQSGGSSGVLGYQAKFGLKNTSGSASTVGKLRVQLLGA